MPYCFETLEQALRLIREVDEEAAADESVAEVIRSHLNGQLRNLSNLVNWAETPQGFDFWSALHSALASFGERFENPADCLAWLDEELSGSSTPEAELPLRGLARWVYDTCRAVTASTRTPSEPPFTPEEKVLLDTWRREITMSTTRALISWAASIGHWSVPLERTFAYLERQDRSYQCLQMVVPLRGSTGNGHNYPVGKPVLMISGKSGLRVGTLGIGNNLCDNRPELVRLATDEEIDLFFRRTDKGLYMPYIATFRSELGGTYPMPEIPL